VIQVLTSVLYALFVVNLIASAGTEALASYFNWRSRLLFRNVRLVLNDHITGLATEIYQSALVHPRSTGDDTGADFEHNLPSYIDPKDFAAALISVLGLENTHLQMLGDKTRREIEDWIEQNVQALSRDRQLRKLIAEMIHATKGAPDAFAASIAAWYGRVSDRIAGAYKRRTQVSNFAIALALAITFDLNPLPPAVAALSQAMSLSDSTPAGAVTVPVPGGPASIPAPGGATPPNARLPSTPAPTSSVGPAMPAASAGNQAQAVHSGMRTGQRIAEQILGWGITAISALFGAPFWFAILSKVTNIRGAGAPPADAKPDAAASPPPAPQAGPSPVAPPPASPPPTPPAPPARAA
jgi:hypothetical protein